MFRLLLTANHTSVENSSGTNQLRFAPLWHINATKPCFVIRKISLFLLDGDTLADAIFRFIQRNHQHAVLKTGLNIVALNFVAERKTALE